MATVNMAPGTETERLQSSGHAPSPAGHTPSPAGHPPFSTVHAPPSSRHVSPSSDHAPLSSGYARQPSGNAHPSSGHAPLFSALHPMIPRFYVLPWKQDMKNQRLLLQNAALAQIPLRPLEESLCLCSRERLCHAQKTLLRPASSPGPRPGPADVQSPGPRPGPADVQSPGPRPGPADVQSPGPDLVQSRLTAPNSSGFSRYNSSVFTTRGLHTHST